VHVEQDRSDEADDGGVLFGKIPTTRKRRLISLSIRSMGLVDQVLGQRAANSSRALSQAASA
jgi:hypothetical protein